MHITSSAVGKLRPLRRVIIGLLALLALVLIGLIALVYLAFVRPPANTPQEFLASGRLSTTQILVVAAGASTTQASLSADYVGRLRQQLGPSGYEFVNAGVNGNTSADLLARLDEIIACQPEAITILIGTNDARAHTEAATNPAAFRANMQQIVARLHRETSARVAILSIPPLGEDLTNASNNVVTEYNQILREVANENGATYLPLHEGLREIIQTEGTQALAEFALRPTLLLSVAFRHYVGGQGWDEIATANGFTVLTDGIHLSDRAGAVAAELIQAWLQTERD